MIDIKRDTIIICDNIYKEKILNNMNNSKELYPIHFMTMNKFIKKYTFDYSYKAILYLMKKYGYKCEVAIKYLDNIYYIEDKKYRSQKLNELNNLKQELDNEKLLIYDPLFKEYIKNKDILIYKYDLNKYEISIINKLDNIKIIPKKYSTYSHTVYECNNEKEEIEFVADSIGKLIENGVDINNIKISNIEGYENIIEKVFKIYKIPCNLNLKYSIYSTKIVKEFLANLNGSIAKAIASIEKYKDSDIYNQIIDICNKYTYDDFIKEILIYDFKHTYIKQINYKNAVEIIDYKNNEIKDEYVFLVGFNLGSIPKTYKDEDFIGDNIKNELHLDMTIDKNVYERAVAIKSINNIRNLIITYKKASNNNKTYPSELVRLFEISKPTISVNKSYSALNDKLKFASYLDNYFKYGEKYDFLDLYNNTYSIPYRSYNNNYTKIDENKLKEYLNNNLTLSYSSMDKYNRCAFRYYLSNILKLDIYNENFFSVIGNLFHHILERGLKKEININEEVKVYVKDKTLTNKELFYLNKFVSELPFILNTIKEQLKLTKLSNSLEETEVVINKEGSIKITFKGFIDKILYKENPDATIIAVIDYKTGISDVNLNYLNYGLNMQLPVYLYLSSHLKFKNIKYAGFYLQKVLLPEIKKDKNKSTSQLKKDYLKLEGFSNSNNDILSYLDITYKDSSMIKGLKLNKDGSFNAYANLISDNNLNKLIKFTEKKIDEVAQNILMCNFDINPKKNDKENIGCKNCTFKNICYKSIKDEVYIKPIEINELLGGENSE